MPLVDSTMAGKMAPNIVGKMVNALPILKSFEDCADFSKTVTPYIRQLSVLPSLLMGAYSSSGSTIESLKGIYIATNPLISTAALTIALTPIVWAVSEINKNYSQVDRLWSILPTLYISNYVLYAHIVGLDTERLDMAAVAFVIWSIRLTFNYWRKGGYQKGSEDYRWMIVKNYVNNDAIWFVFNLSFIVIYQMILLFMVATPAYILLCATNMGMPMTWIDTMAPRCILAFVLLEFMADQQQWSYQSAKSAYKSTAKVPVGFTQEDLDRGFVVSGLWTWCRHPNFACEQAIWLVLYQWSNIITDSWYNWTVVGVVGYLAIFQGSTWLTEMITAGKYPEYREYQRRVNRFLPTLSSELPEDNGGRKRDPWAVPEGMNGTAKRVNNAAKKRN